MTIRRREPELTIHLGPLRGGARGLVAVLGLVAIAILLIAAVVA